jgi:hypothetical protein
LMAFASDPSRYKIQVHPNELIRQMVQMIAGLAQLLFERTWQFLVTTDGTFATSDAPVSLWTHSDRQHPLYGRGFGAAEELALPRPRSPAQSIEPRSSRRSPSVRCTGVLDRALDPSRGALASCPADPRPSRARQIGMSNSANRSTLPGILTGTSPQ